MPRTAEARFIDTCIGWRSIWTPSQWLEAPNQPSAEQTNRLQASPPTAGQPTHLLFERPHHLWQLKVLGRHHHGLHSGRSVPRRRWPRRPRVLPRRPRRLLIQAHHNACSSRLLPLSVCQAGLCGAGGCGGIALCCVSGGGRRLGTAGLLPSLLQQGRNGGLRLWGRGRK